MMTSDDSWFLVLPDHEATAAVVDGLRLSPTRRVAHPSGRPWLLAGARQQDVIVTEMPHGRLAVIGHCPITAAELSTHAAELTSLDDLDGLALRLPGSFHLAATLHGDVRVQGTVSGLRRIFHGRAGRVAVAADRADVVAALTGAGVDPERLALWLLHPGAPAPLSEATPWRGVRHLPPDACLHLDAGGTVRERLWWRAPEPATPLAAGATRLAEALTGAMTAFTRQRPSVGADLSGGLDSTALCFLAARCGAAVSAVTHAGPDADPDGVTRARAAAETLAARGEFTHQVLGADELPPPCAALWQPGEPMDEPFAGLRGAARLAFGVERAAAVRAGVDAQYHLAGFGADEVLRVPPAALHTLLRQRPRTALAGIRGGRARHGWPLRPMLGALADRRPYARWLAAAAGQVAAYGTARDGAPALHWDGPFRVAPWVTPAATDTIRRQIRDAADGARPLAATRGQHATLAAIRRGAGAYRLVQRFVDRTGRRLRLPFLDDRVLDACLAVDLGERGAPGPAKPLLTEALRDIVPPDATGRPTRSDLAGEPHTGVREFTAELTDLLDEPLIGRLGLVDADALRAACLGPYPATVPAAAVEAALATEVWLRALPGTLRDATPLRPRTPQALR
jgi:asparagine synthase (glutamine-hydrolysing)